MNWVWKLTPYETALEETYGQDWRKLADSSIPPGTLWKLSCTDDAGKEYIPSLFVDMADLAHLADVIKETAEQAAR